MRTASLPTGRTAFTAERRRVLLQQYFTAGRSLREIDGLGSGATGFEARRLARHQEYYLRTVSTLLAEYVAGVPVVALSRCPFTGEVMHHSLDHYGLDGLWWDYLAPARPEEQLPATYFAVTGAVRLGSDVRNTPFLCKPGPEVPFVLPRLLQHPSMVAVLFSLPVGGHQGYAIAYFADPMPWDLPRVNSWGANEYRFVDQEGVTGWDAQPEKLEEFDFELEPWLTAGRLRWIAPGDQSMTIREGVQGCPYLGLKGRRTVTRIQHGKVW